MTLLKALENLETTFNINGIKILSITKTALIGNDYQEIIIRIKSGRIFPITYLPKDNNINIFIGVVGGTSELNIRLTHKKK